MSQPATNFLGIPIEGDITRPRPGTVQRPREEFEPLVRALLDDPFIVDFGWHQYTPYFNDGDPCVFGANNFWVRTAEDTKDPDDEDFDPDDEDFDPYDFAVSYSTHPTLGGNEGYGAEAEYVGTKETQWSAARALSDAVENGAFDHVLLDLFGDHCEVKVGRTGIIVDEYSHD